MCSPVWHSPIVCAAVVALSATVSLPVPSSIAEEAASKPNIVLILADDLGDRSLSCFGATVPTPNLDRLCRDELAGHIHAPLENH